jgi:hypothetical protein
MTIASRSDSVLRTLEEGAQQVPRRHWIEDLLDYFRRNGYRPEEFRGLLGSFGRRVELSEEGARRVLLGKYQSKRG